MATAPTYCTHRQLKDVFPQVDSFDSKRPVYGWESLGNNIYVAQNTGLITQLFKDGKELNEASVSAVGGWLTTTTATVDQKPDPDSTTYNIINYNAGGFTTGDEGDIKAGTYATINTSSAIEYFFIESVNTAANQITVRRGALGSDILAHTSGVVLYEHYDFNEATEWFYDSYFDQVVMYSATNPNDLNMEAGEDFSTLITRITANASRYLDAKLDPNLPKEQLKDKEGNYDYIIVRTTALLAAVFLIRSHDPTSEVATAMMEDAMGNIDALNKGGASLSWQTTGDSSKGIIRDVSYTSGSVRPVDTRGRWSGTFDLIRVKIETGGVMDGTATYSIWVKDGDKLGNQQGNQVVTSEKINGDYQALAGGLQIRFGGSSKTSVATATDEWEIEVAGWQEEVDNSAINSVKMTRGGIGSRRFGKY